MKWRALVGRAAPPRAHTRTFCQRCKHCTSVRRPCRNSTEIRFQWRGPTAVTPARSASSSSGVHIPRTARAAVGTTCACVARAEWRGARSCEGGHMRTLSTLGTSWRHGCHCGGACTTMCDGSSARWPIQTATTQASDWSEKALQLPVSVQWRAPSSAANGPVHMIQQYGVEHADHARSGTPSITPISEGAAAHSSPTRSRSPQLERVAWLSWSERDWDVSAQNGNIDAYQRKQLWDVLQVLQRVDRLAMQSTPRWIDGAAVMPSRRPGCRRALPC